MVCDSSDGYLIQVEEENHAQNMPFPGHVPISAVISTTLFVLWHHWKVLMVLSLVGSCSLVTGFLLSLSRWHDRDSESWIFLAPFHFLIVVLCTLTSRAAMILATAQVLSRGEPRVKDCLGAGLARVGSLWSADLLLCLC